MATDEPPPAGAGNVNIAFLIFKGNCGVPYFAKEHSFLGGNFSPKTMKRHLFFSMDRPSLHNNSPSKILPIHAVVHLRLCHPLYATWLDAWRLATCIHCCAADWFHVDLVCLAVVESTLAHGFFKRAFDTRFCHRNKLMVSFQVAPFHGTSSMDIQWPQHIGCHWLDNYFSCPLYNPKTRGISF